jgi:hypothetical protein
MSDNSDEIQDNSDNSDETQDNSDDNYELQNNFSVLRTKKLKHLAGILYYKFPFAFSGNKITERIVTIVEKYELLFREHPNVSCFIIASLIYGIQNFTDKWNEKEDMMKELTQNDEKNNKSKFTNIFDISRGIYKNKKWEENELIIDLCRYNLFLNKFFEAHPQKK